MLSARARGTQRSAIRELLKLTQQPDIISFAGGLPDPETFPRVEMAEIANDAIRYNCEKVLQYSTSEGCDQFRQQAVKWLNKRGIDVTIENILVTTASQQGLDLLSKTFLNPGDTVFCGLPTYLGAISSFRLFQANLEGVPLESDGMNFDKLEKRIKECKEIGRNLKAIYVIPDFQNPTGITMSQCKRVRLLEIAQKYNLVVFEDDPYSQLRFKGEPLPTLQSLDDSGGVLTLMTFSKVIAAGLRLAILVTTNKEYMEYLVRIKQSSDLCTSKLTQCLAGTFMEQQDGLEDHLKEIRQSYKQKRNWMLEALEEHMPKNVSWTKPCGGLFVWVTLPEQIDAQEMFEAAIQRKVAYVPGNSFYVDGSGKNTLRLSFSVANKEEAQEGIKRLGETIQEFSLEAVSSS